MNTESEVKLTHAQQALLAFLTQVRTTSVISCAKAVDARVHHMKIYRWDLAQFIHHYTFTDGSLLTTHGAGKNWRGSTAFPDGKSANNSREYSRADKEL